MERGFPLLFVVCPKRPSQTCRCSPCAADRMIPVKWSDVRPPKIFSFRMEYFLTGSSGTRNTIGIVVVALPATTDAGALAAAITLTRRRTRSSAIAGRRSGRFSAQRYSIAMHEVDDASILKTGHPDTLSMISTLVNELADAPASAGYRAAI
jgi:hypothetical protein